MGSTFQPPTTYTSQLPAGAPPVADDTADLWLQTQPANEATGVTDSDIGFPWLKFLDGVGQILQRVDDLCSDDQTAGAPGWSIILDPARCPTYALPWLAQCVGVRFNANTASDATQRAALSGEAGFKRGTLAAIQAVASSYLMAGQAVAVQERTPDAYSLTVTFDLAGAAGQTYAQSTGEWGTYTARTAGHATYGTGEFPTAAATAAIKAAVPAGLVCTVNILSGPTYAHIAGLYSTYSARESAIPTYADVATH